MTAPLKPCPFCGGHLVPRFPGWFDHPKSKCILSGKAFPKGYIGQWNARADAPELLALVDALREVATRPTLYTDGGELDWLIDDAEKALSAYEAMK